MLTIGVYDSGIGGLTTLKELIRNFGGQKFVYFADNANMPFGTKNLGELKPVVTRHLEKLKNLSDIQVVACNTASTMPISEGFITLCPKIENYNPDTTLLLSTPTTQRNLNAKEIGFHTADTRNLATLVEIVASLSFKRRVLDFSLLKGYLVDNIKANNGITDILIGCSHYVYLEKIISTLLKNTRLDDGNQYVVEEVSHYVKRIGETHDIKFVFSGTNEKAKYEWILSELLKPD